MYQYQTKESKSKYKKFNEKMFGHFFSAILMSIGISFAAYGAATVGYAVKLMSTRIFFIIIYWSASIIIFFLWIYTLIQYYRTHHHGDNENFKVPLCNKGEKVNIYLRFGVGLFGISSLLFGCIGTYIHYLDSDEKNSSIIHGVSECVFVTFQALFILVNHRIIYLAHGNIIKVSFLYLALANMLMWANTAIGKISSEFESSAPCNDYKNDALCKLSIYLQPTLSEYNVICSAVIYEIFKRINEEGSKEHEDEHEHEKSKNQKKCKCSSLVYGIIGGFIVLLFCAFTSISSVVLTILKIANRWLYFFHSGEMIFLNVIGIIFLFIAFYKINVMKFSYGFVTHTLDKTILFTSYILALNFSIIVLLNCGYHLYIGLHLEYLSEIRIRLASAVFEIVQSSLQTYCILNWFERCFDNTEGKTKKPGKCYIAVLIGINFGMWFIWTLQIKNDDIIYLKVNKEYIFITSFDSTAFQDLLLFVLQSTLPQGMLYRYHSSACLSEIYSKMYQTEHERRVHHLKSEQSEITISNEDEDQNNSSNSKRSLTIEDKTINFDGSNIMRNSSRNKVQYEMFNDLTKL